MSLSSYNCWSTAGPLYPLSAIKDVLRMPEAELPSNKKYGKTIGDIPF